MTAATYGSRWCRARQVRMASSALLLTITTGRPAVARSGLRGVTFHGLRHSFVAILVAAGCNVREVSEWAGHNSVAFTLTRYGGLFEDGSDAAIDRLDALLGGATRGPKNVVPLRKSNGL